jgi:hypothetical protein
VHRLVPETGTPMGGWATMFTKSQATLPQPTEPSKVSGRLAAPFPGRNRSFTCGRRGRKNLSVPLSVLALTVCSVVLLSAREGRCRPIHLDLGGHGKIWELDAGARRHGPKRRAAIHPRRAHTLAIWHQTSCIQQSTGAGCGKVIQSLKDQASTSIHQV